MNNPSCHIALRLGTPRPSPRVCSSIAPLWSEARRNQKHSTLRKYLHNLAVRLGLTPRLPQDIQWVMDELERLDKEGISLSSLCIPAVVSPVEDTPNSPRSAQPAREAL